MFYRITADIVVLIHFLWIIFLIFGAFIGRRYKRIKIFHITGIGFAVIIQIFSWYCPLTYIEIWLRQKRTPSQSYTGSFIINYVEKLVYVELSHRIIFLATIILIFVSVGVYLYKPKKTDI